MIVGKEFKSMYIFLKKVYGILNKGGDDAILYANANGELMYKSFCVSGKIKIVREEQNLLKDELKQNCFYELSKLPRDRFKLKEIEDKKVTDDMRETLQTLIKKIRLSSDFVCEVSEDDDHLISKITRLCERYVSDTYIGMIKSFGTCEVSAKGPYITLEKNEYFKDERADAEETMCLYCETYKDIDENVQGKMKFEEQERYSK